MDLVRRHDGLSLVSWRLRYGGDVVEGLAGDRHGSSKIGSSLASGPESRDVGLEAQQLPSRAVSDGKFL